jgi:ATP-dependent DNA ligase
MEILRRLDLAGGELPSSLETFVEGTAARNANSRCGSDWLYEIKYDGCRLIVQRESIRIINF